MNIAFKQIWELGCEAWPNVSELVLLKTGPRSLSKGYGREAEGVFVICHLVCCTGLRVGSTLLLKGENLRRETRLDYLQAVTRVQRETTGMIVAPYITISFQLNTSLQQKQNAATY